MTALDFNVAAARRGEFNRMIILLLMASQNGFDFGYFDIDLTGMRFNLDTASAGRAALNAATRAVDRHCRMMAKFDASNGAEINDHVAVIACRNDAAIHNRRARLRVVAVE